MKSVFGTMMITFALVTVAQVKTEVPAVVPAAKPVAVEHIKIHGAALEGNLEKDDVDGETTARGKGRQQRVVDRQHIQGALEPLVGDRAAERDNVHARGETHRVDRLGKRDVEEEGGARDAVQLSVEHAQQSGRLHRSTGPGQAIPQSYQSGEIDRINHS